MIQCKRVYEQATSKDGYRILVDRLWPRGIKKTDLACDEWCKALTPSSELRKAFHSETIDFTAFSEAYRKELAQHPDETPGGSRQTADRDATLWGEKYGAESRAGTGGLAA